MQQRNVQTRRTKGFVEVCERVCTVCGWVDGRMGWRAGVEVQSPCDEWIARHVFSPRISPVVEAIDARVTYDLLLGSTVRCTVLYCTAL